MGQGSERAASKTSGLLAGKPKVQGRWGRTLWAFRDAEIVAQALKAESSDEFKYICRTQRAKFEGVNVSSWLWPIYGHSI